MKLSIFLIASLVVLGACGPSENKPGVTKTYSQNGNTFECEVAACFMLGHSGTRISRGYHSFTKVNDTVWVANIGSGLFLLKDGVQKGQEYTAIEANRNGGFRAYIGSTVRVLDKNGDAT